MTTTFLADATRNGAKVVTGIYADRVITAAVSPDSLSHGHVSHDLTNGVSSQDGHADLDSNSNHAAHAEHARAQQAEGVVAYVGTGTDRIKCVFKAPIVVSSAGSINSPALLLRSGITVNGNVGKHLHLHPAAVAPSIFSEKEHGKINMWEGPMMTAYSPDAPDWEGSGYGPMVSTPPVPSTTPAAPLSARVACSKSGLCCLEHHAFPHSTSRAHIRHICCHSIFHAKLEFVVGAVPCAQDEVRTPHKPVQKILVGANRSWPASAAHHVQTCIMSEHWCTCQRTPLGCK